MFLIVVVVVVLFSRCQKIWATIAMARGNHWEVNEMTWRLEDWDWVSCDYGMGWWESFEDALCLTGALKGSGTGLCSS